MTCGCFRCQEKSPSNDVLEPCWNKRELSCRGCSKTLGFVDYYPDGGALCSDCQSLGFKQHERIYSTKEADGQ